jgi:hypothetical protein
MAEVDHRSENRRELERLRALVAGLGAGELATPITPEWSVADVLGHLAFWDARALLLAQKLQRGEPWIESDYETDEVDVLNGAVFRLIRAIEPAAVAELALSTAAEVDAAVADLPRDRMWPYASHSPLNCLRAGHRGEHLDQVEAALGRRQGAPRTR